MKTTVAAIEELVRVVADNAAQGKVKLSEKTEALRVLAPYYTTLTKGRGGASSDEDEKVTIGRLQNAVRQAEDSNGRTVPDHKRRRRTEEAHED